MLSRLSSKGFTLIEMVLVIIVIGIIGSMASVILYEGSVVFADETNRQGFVSQSRSAFWRLMRNVQGQANPENFYLSDDKNIFITSGVGEQREFRIHESGSLDLNLGTGTYHSLSDDVSLTGTVGFSYYDKQNYPLDPGGSGLSMEIANEVHSSRVQVLFKSGQDSLYLDTYIHPINFRFGKKMSYHH